MNLIRVSRISRILIALAAGSAAGISCPGTAKAGFFDFLFGALAPSQPAYDPNLHPQGFGSTQGVRRRADRSFHRHDQKARRKIVVAARTDNPSRPQKPVTLLDDDSLRKGDIVVMPEGLRIFAGVPGSRHSPEDFKKPSEVKSLSKPERKALAGMDPRASFPESKEGLVTGRSATDQKLSPGEVITDPRGRMVRYVGP
ncbi:MAG TPA: hypothetical protein VFG05_07980 [Methylocella sp.]|nr:hypothetical protein [Methylocella sp.]